MTQTRTLDIFWVLNQLDSKNFELWDQLTEDQRKEVSPFVILRWLTGCADPEQLVMLGEVASACLFEFGQQKELMLKVLAACTANGGKRYKWVNPKGATKSSSKAVQLIALTYKMSLRQATEVRPQFTAEEIVELATAQGWQKDEVKELQKELT
jgi:hypothetical protein